MTAKLIPVEIATVYLRPYRLALQQGDKPLRSFPSHPLDECMEVWRRRGESHGLELPIYY
ncbi:hypothetical protein ASNO1_47400 [Corallococcus caeni]|uniref:Uncharacterized protein n=1 Tax=Corallococcus caeni TaxID=3082388 RepID=A0ABQ6QWU7_9BACT|nr:hypothetical protein ASNO1_47400 [Corallococcus sp. NO1]